MSALTDHEDLLDIVLFERPDKGLQYRLSITEFRGVKYFGVREWYADYEGKFSASQNGFTMPYEMSVCSSLLSALVSLLSKAEVLKETGSELESIKLTQLKDLEILHNLSKNSAVSLNQLRDLKVVDSLNYETDTILITLEVPRHAKY